MKNYIVRIGNKNVINKLRGNFEKVGTPRALFKTIIVSTTKTPLRYPFGQLLHQG